MFERFRQVGAFLGTVAANVTAMVVIALGSVAWAFFAGSFSTENKLWGLGLLIWVAVSYLLFLSIRYLFPQKYRIAKDINLHLAVFSILTISIMVPLAMSFSLQGIEVESLIRKIEVAHAENEEADSRTLQLYSLVSDSVGELLHQKALGEELLHEILSHCVESIRISSDEFEEIRATAVYIDESGTNLVMPKWGYYGVGFDRNIERL